MILKKDMKYNVKLKTEVFKVARDSVKLEDGRIQNSETED